MTQNEQSIYEMIGGAETFRKLVDTFYAKVEADDDLRAIFPEDLEPGKEWQYLFLMQRWGGPPEYHVKRGHPRMRARHMPYAITMELRDRWVQHMLDSMTEVGIEEPAYTTLKDYFEQGATFMVNRY